MLRFRWLLVRRYVRLGLFFSSLCCLVWLLRLTRHPLPFVQISTDQLLDAISPVRHPLWQLYIDDFPTSLTKDEGRHLKIHYVLFSHTDPGWLSSADDYFHRAARILDNVVDRLNNQPDTHFVWSEIIFLKMWWEKRPAKARQALLDVLNQGRLEIVYPATVMPDEALPDLAALLNNHISGHMWLRETLNVSVKTAWSADSFGLSSSVAYIHSVFNVSNLLVQRANYKIKEHLAATRSLEFIWKQEWSDHDSTSMLTSMNPFKLYAIPFNCGPEKRVCCMFDFWRGPGGCKDMYFPWETSLTGEDVQKNWDASVRSLAQQYQLKASLFRTDNLLVLVGDDFRFSERAEWNVQIEMHRQLIEHFATNPELKITAKFSNLSSYFDAIRADNKLWPSITGDFLPYIDRWNEYWSGYYSTRPFLKQLGRRTAEVLSLVSRLVSECQLRTTCENPGVALKTLQRSQQSVDNFLHHDLITGTSRARVIQDFVTQLSNTMRDLERMFWKYTQKLGTSTAADLDEKKTKMIAISNLHAAPFRGVINLDLGDKWSSDSSDLKLIKYALNSEVPSISSTILRPNGQMLAYVDLSPFTSQTYFIAQVPTSAQLESRVSPAKKQNFRPKFGSSGELEYIYIASLDLKLPIRIWFELFGTYTSVPLYYITNQSGAYIFLHDGSRDKVRPTPHQRSLVYEDDSLWMRSSSYQGANYTMTLFKSHDTVQSQVIQLDVQYDMRHLQDTELALVFNTGLLTDGYFYTDSNALRPVKRQYRHKFPLPGNVYPMSSYCQLTDGHTWFSVIAEHAHGVTSSSSGELVLFLDRTHSHHDWRGLTEGVQDNQPGKVTLWLSISDTQNDALWLAHHLNNRPSVMEADGQTATTTVTLETGFLSGECDGSSRLLTSHFDTWTNSTVVAWQRMKPWSNSPYAGDCRGFSDKWPYLSENNEVFSVSVFNASTGRQIP
jgi:alpha-mannosidase II